MDVEDDESDTLAKQLRDLQLEETIVISNIRDYSEKIKRKEDLMKKIDETIASDESERVVEQYKALKISTKRELDELNEKILSELNRLTQIRAEIKIVKESKAEQQPVTLETAMDKYKLDAREQDLLTSFDSLRENQIYEILLASRIHDVWNLLNDYEKKAQRLKTNDSHGYLPYAQLLIAQLTSNYNFLCAFAIQHKIDVPGHVEQGKLVELYSENQFRNQAELWHTLNRLADAVASLHGQRLTLGAPVPSNVSNRDWLLTEERRFSYTDEPIPKNYKDVLVTLIDIIKNYYDKSESDGCRRFDTQVVILSVGYKGNDAVVQYMHTRPCAMHCGFENYVLWNLRDIVIQKNYNGIIFDYCEPYHAKILRSMGFTNYGDSYSITSDTLRRATVASWKVKALAHFPTADQLNSQEWVNAKHSPASMSP